MSAQVLILGGSGRIGSSVAADLLTFTQAKIVIAGRNPILGKKVCDHLGERGQFLPLDLGDHDGLTQAISQADLVIHCAGPFHYRDTQVLETCIHHGVSYVDVSDHPSFTRKAMNCTAAAAAAGVTAIVNTGIFPGISNSMVRQDVEQLDEAETIHLSYAVAGSGGAGVTVMRTTFLGLQKPFSAWIDGAWKTVKPYSDRETIEFPQPYGRTGVYWFDMPETFTLSSTFPVKTVITKFGTIPDFYNHLTWSVARWWHPWLLKQPFVIEFLSQVSHFMTDVTDSFSGIGVAIRSEVIGMKDGKATQVCSTLTHPNTAIAAGYGTGSIAELILSGQLDKPGVWVVEQALPTNLFTQTLQQRGIQIEQSIQTLPHATINS
ncbi:saccharopine dehydrogenase NADP-binding domain-containing protein [Phormidium sp. CLA17]|uniref:saccharopine dehydrogenase family protein n=1 Tax=Leptolyngbya sp. Cla-17 TaxID=2803751 RepID=UPI00149180CE|nr:saccharopine dehydrogenase NADP-binding domain-containing protein [Leptolyngbya sp. Cla-17]MBM0743787.1 saccharopine dehydrogenase NADP-binding domain-containing protein [Leptolyngbya sp. Cla-17]